MKCDVCGYYTDQQEHLIGCPTQRVNILHVLPAYADFSTPMAMFCGKPINDLRGNGEYWLPMSQWREATCVDCIQAMAIKKQLSLV
jgi:hypothetical protein